MPRPRTHDPDAVLDAAESLAVRSGPAAVTIRAVAAATGVSNGAIYHTFGSRAELLGRSWLRAARRYLAMQTELVEAHLGADASASDVIAAVIAVAETPVAFAEQYPDSGKLLLTVSRGELLGDELPAEVAAELAGTDDTLVRLMVRLARALWGRGDRAAVDVITTCVVDLPTAILLRRDRLAKPIARQHLRAAVRAVLAIGPPDRPSTPPKGTP
ncbi:TetR/AcrR family transcriptional regulator [Nocardia sp. NBC_00565]|uniref:TetR/AcrR family transcriptional regulator n=1 Tax=Nocardia sp. NBC_00565 TaxID=2975993 RepID=UPI002E8068F0|nr:helix-turn-helix domain-containing protein [Nocardia sp. NBC_00565]WUC06191.1 TetR/AcrR family transcriptional regulator [Nocardia sp. NBC_00565]